MEIKSPQIVNRAPSFHPVFSRFQDKCLGHQMTLSIFRENCLLSAESWFSTGLVVCGHTKCVTKSPWPLLLVRINRASIFDTRGVHLVQGALGRV